MATFDELVAKQLGLGSTQSGLTMGGTVTGPTTDTRTSATSEQGSSRERGVTNVRSTNMTPDSLAALEAVIQALGQGGTPTQQAQASAIANSLQVLSNQLPQYSKGAAFGDAENAVNALFADAMDRGQGELARNVAAAGTSGGAAQQLYMQDIIDEAARTASQLQLEAATNYGNIQSQLSSGISNLAATPDPATQALLEALQVAKGAVENTTVTEDSTSTSTRSSSGTSRSYTAPRSSLTWEADLGGIEEAISSDVTQDLLNTFTDPSNLFTSSTRFGGL